MTVHAPEAPVRPEPPIAETGAIGTEAAALPPGSPADAQPEPPAGFGETLGALREEMMHALHERLHLIALEFKQVSLNATQMVLLATVAGLMLAGAWATVLVGIYMACTHNGMPWGVALLLVLILNVVGAGLAWVRAHSLSDAFTFPASLRMLKRLTGSQPKAPT